MIRILKRLKPWHIVGTVVALTVAVTAVYGTSTMSGGPRADDTGPSQQTGAAQQPVTREIPVNGHLVFSYEGIVKGEETRR